MDKIPPAGTPPSWACDCCGKSFIWSPRDPIKGIQMLPVYDRGPHQVTFGDKTYHACCSKCVRHVYFVRGLDSVFSKIVEALKYMERPHV